MEPKPKKRYYIVKRGHHPGVYYSWPDCQKEVAGFPGAVFRGFVTQKEAEDWYGKPVAPAPRTAPAGGAGKAPAVPTDGAARYPAKVTVMAPGLTSSRDLPPSLVIYTDGSCLVNPKGPGGFAAVFLTNDGRELIRVTGGEPSTTNNRMELRAAAEALRYVIGRTVDFHTDSQYLMKAFTNHWLDKWQKNGWKTTAGTGVANQDLWKLLLDRMAKARVSFTWVKGHAGTKYNELCDKLAKAEAGKFGT